MPYALWAETKQLLWHDWTRDRMSLVGVCMCLVLVSEYGQRTMNLVHELRMGQPSDWTALLGLPCAQSLPHT